MPKITVIGAGSVTFTKNVIGDSMLTPSLQDMEVALYDIDPERLNEAENMLNNLNQNINESRALIKAYNDRREALRGADFVINCIQVGGYKPATVIDFEIPFKYGLKQTIGDTLGIGGIFRALRTIPVMLSFAYEMEEVCPNAWLLNYTNPMGMLTGAVLKGSGIKAVGLCHSVQQVVKNLFELLGLDYTGVVSKVAGINHQAWLLEVKRGGEDLYPMLRKMAWEGVYNTPKKADRVRIEFLKQLGYFVTEGSAHAAEYVPYFIKDRYPELIERFEIPIGEYLMVCERKLKKWEDMKEQLVNNVAIEHVRSKEYAAGIMNAMITNTPYKVGGNVLNKGIITNLPADACVEVPCLIDGSGVTPTYVGKLPTHLAAINITNINVQLLAIEAALTLKKENIYYAAMLDPLTSSTLSIDDIKAMVDEMIEAHGDYLPKYS